MIAKHGLQREAMITSYRCEKHAPINALTIVRTRDITRMSVNANAAAHSVFTSFEPRSEVNTVKPLLSGHPRDIPKCPLNRSVR